MQSLYKCSQSVHPQKLPFSSRCKKKKKKKKKKNKKNERCTCKRICHNQYILIAY